MKLYLIFSTLSGVIVCGAAAIGVHAFTNKPPASTISPPQAFSSGNSYREQSDLTSTWKQLLTQSSSTEQLSLSEEKIWKNLFGKLNQKRAEFSPELSPLTPPTFNRETFQKEFRSSLEKTNSELSAIIAKQQNAGLRKQLSSKLEEEGQKLITELKTLSQLSDPSLNLVALLDNKVNKINLNNATKAQFALQRELGLTKTTGNLQVSAKPLAYGFRDFRPKSQVRRKSVPKVTKGEIDSVYNQNWKTYLAARIAKLPGSAGAAAGRGLDPETEQVIRRGFEKTAQANRSAIAQNLQARINANFDQAAWNKVPTDIINNISLTEAENFCKQLNNDPKVKNYLSTSRLEYRLIRAGEWNQISPNLSDKRIPTLLSNGSAGGPTATTPDGETLMCFRLVLAPKE